MTSPYDCVESSTGQKRILVVDDDFAVNRMVSLALKSDGYLVNSAENGEQGWEAMGATNYNLLITDYAMPKLNGLDLLRRMREHSFSIPAILMSADMPRNVAEIMELVSSGGALHKPFALGELLYRVETILDLESGVGKSAPLSPITRKARGHKERALIQLTAQNNLTDLATKILGCESAPQRSPTRQPAICSVCERMRKPLQNLSGETGLRSILSRALFLSKNEQSWLEPVKISTNGLFDGLDRAEEKLTEVEIVRGETTILVQVLSLLFTFLGESMTRIVLDEVWSGLR